MTIVCVSIGSVQAENLEHGTITSCAYQAGTAYEIQKIRQTEGDDWETFETKIKSIYKNLKAVMIYCKLPNRYLSSQPVNQRILFMTRFLMPALNVNKALSQFTDF